MVLSEKRRYLLASTRKRLRGEGKACPSCGSLRSLPAARKYLVTELRRCESCELLFRVPTTNREASTAFYQKRYAQGFTTDLPSTAELDALTKQGFNGTEKDYTTYLAVLDALGVKAGARVLDFGCSWGYGSWQLTRAGYEVVGFEVSRPRCRFAKEELGVDCHADLAEIAPPFDVFFSAHVLEHVPAVSEVVASARRLLRPGGLFVAFTPNGSDELRVRQPETWMKLWGLAHQNFLDPRYYRQMFATGRLLLASSPYDLGAIGRWEDGALDGDELLAVARFG